MKNLLNLKRIFLTAALACVLCSQGRAGILVNSGFESGFTGWTRADQIGSDGTFALQSGIASPVNAIPVPAPPGGTLAAMTDAQGPGSHILYQDFVVPTLVGSASLHFDIFIGNRAAAFSTPASLDFSTPALNQQARVDIIKTSANPFSVAAADVLLNAYQTVSGNPLVSGYNHITVDLTSLVNSNLGTTLRLRFAEADNVNFFQLGVDNADIDTSVAGVPEPSHSWLVAGALACVAVYRLRRASNA